MRSPRIPVAFALLFSALFVPETPAPFARIPDWKNYDVFTYSLFKGRAYLQSGEVTVVTNVITDMVPLTNVTIFTNIDAGPKILTVTNLTTGAITTTTNPGPITNISVLTEYLSVPGTNRTTNLATVVTPFLLGEQRWLFEARVLGTNIVAASVQTPATTLLIPEAPEDSVQDLSLGMVAAGVSGVPRFTCWTANSQADLEREIGSGNFTLSIDSTRFGVQTDSFFLEPDLFPAAIPTVTGNGVQVYDSATRRWKTPAPYDPSTDLTLQTQAPPDGSSFSLQFAEIADDPSAPLLPQRVSYIPTYSEGRISLAIPNGELKPGRRYAGLLRYSRVSQSHSWTYITEALGSAGYFNETTFYLEVGSEPKPTFSIQQLDSPQSGSYTAVLATQGRTNLQVQTSSDLITWKNLGTNAIVNGEISIPFNVTNSPASFFRAIPTSVVRVKP